MDVDAACWPMCTEKAAVLKEDILNIINLLADAHGSSCPNELGHEFCDVKYACVIISFVGVLYKVCRYSAKFAVSLPPPRRLCFCQSLFVCMCVSKITQKVIEGSFWNFQEMSRMAKTTSDSIFGGDPAGILDSGSLCLAEVCAVRVFVEINELCQMAPKKWTTCA